MGISTMTSKGLQTWGRSLRSIRTCPSGVKDPLTQCLALRFSRSMATEAAMPANLTQEFNPSFLETATDPTYSLPDPTVLTTIYKFPTMEPVRFESYNSKHLQSPMLKGGGKSFGPHPRDFATGLPRKMYDLAWRTALSWRYRRGELIICENGMDIEYPKTQFI